MLIRELLSEVKKPLTVVDLRYEEPSDPKRVLKHWGSEPKEYIHPQDGFFWHWNEGKLLLHSEKNENYSWKMAQLLGLRDQNEKNNHWVSCGINSTAKWISKIRQ
jgi:hypothetical protein